MEIEAAGTGKFHYVTKCKAGGVKPLNFDVKYGGSVIIVLLRIIDGRRSTLMAVGIPPEDLPAKYFLDLYVRRVGDAAGKYTAQLGRGGGPGRPRSGARPGKFMEVLGLGEAVADFLGELQRKLPEYIRKAYYDATCPTKVQEPRRMPLKQARVYTHGGTDFLEAVAHEASCSASEVTGTQFSGFSQFAAIRAHCNPASEEFKYLERCAAPYFPTMSRDMEFDRWGPGPGGIARIQEKATCAKLNGNSLLIKYHLKGQRMSGQSRQYRFTKDKHGELQGGFDRLLLQLVWRRDLSGDIDGMHLRFPQLRKVGRGGGVSISEEKIEAAWPEAELLGVWDLSVKDLDDAGCFKEETGPGGAKEYLLPLKISMVLPEEVAKKVAEKLVRVENGRAEHLTPEDQQEMVARCTRNRTADTVEKQRRLNKCWKSLGV